MKIANCFLVGAPKCGTTSLSEYLRGHPNVFLSYPKEPYFFADDFPRLRSVATPGRYAKLFREVGPAHAICGEASAGYLYSSVAIANLRRYNPDARLIVMLRNPADMIYSLHAQLLFNFDEDQPDFAAAWQLQDLRARGLRVPRRCRAPEFLQYGRVGRLGDQVERMLAVFPRGQVLFLFFDDLRASVRDVYEQVLKFLELPADGRRVFPRVNEHKAHRSRWLGYLWVRKPRLLRGPIEACKRRLGTRKLACETRLTNLYARKAQRPPLEEGFRGELWNFFQDDIARLAELTGRDLGHWHPARRAA